MVGGGAVMVAIIIAVLQGSFLVSLLMALSIIMVVLQVRQGGTRGVERVNDKERQHVQVSVHER